MLLKNKPRNLRMKFQKYDRSSSHNIWGDVNYADGVRWDKLLNIQLNNVLKNFLYWTLNLQLHKDLAKENRCKDQ